VATVVLFGVAAGGPAHATIIFGRVSSSSIVIGADGRTTQAAGQKDVDACAFRRIGERMYVAAAGVVGNDPGGFDALQLVVDAFAQSKNTLAALASSEQRIREHTLDVLASGLRDHIDKSNPVLLDLMVFGFDARGIAVLHRRHFQMEESGRIDVSGKDCPDNCAPGILTAGLPIYIGPPATSAEANEPQYFVDVVGQRNGTARAIRRLLKRALRSGASNDRRRRIDILTITTHGVRWNARTKQCGNEPPLE
jgi:hypothetical protein